MAGTKKKQLNKASAFDVSQISQISHKYRKLMVGNKNEVDNQKVNLPRTVFFLRTAALKRGLSWGATQPLGRFC